MGLFTLLFTVILSEHHQIRQKEKLNCTRNQSRKNLKEWHHRFDDTTPPTPTPHPVSRFSLFHLFTNHNKYYIWKACFLPGGYSTYLQICAWYMPPLCAFSWEVHKFLEHQDSCSKNLKNVLKKSRTYKATAIQFLHILVVKKLCNHQEILWLP